MAAVRVSLVQCPVWGVDDPPLGLAQMAGCVTHCNQEARVFDLNLRFWRDSAPDLKRFWSWDALPLWSSAAWTGGLLSRSSSLWDRYAEEVLAWEPHAVAFSVAAGSQWATLELARRVKRLSPEAATIFGGPFAAHMERAESLLSDAAVDIVVAGAGEDVFTKMIGLFRATRRWIALPGMLVKGPEGVVRGGRPAPYTFDLDASPAPDFSGFSWSEYARPEQVPLSASRGCTERCAFCSSREFWTGYSFKSGDRIFGEAARLREAHPECRRIQFYDIMANGNVASLVRFAERAKDGLAPPKPAWRMNAAPRPEMTPHVLATLRAGGCDEIVYGIESGSDAVLGRMGRPWRASGMETVLQSTREAGIRCAATFITGFPGESADDFQRTLSFMRRARNWIDSTSVAPAAFEEPSALYRRPERFSEDGRESNALAPQGLERARRLIEEACALDMPVDERGLTIPSRSEVSAEAL